MEDDNPFLFFEDDANHDNNGVSIPKNDKLLNNSIEEHRIQDWSSRDNKDAQNSDDKRDDITLDSYKNGSLSNIYSQDDETPFLNQKNLRKPSSTTLCEPLSKKAKGDIAAFVGTL